MCRELSDMARSQRLDLLGYLLVLAQKEAEAQSGGLPDPERVEDLNTETSETD